MSPVPQRLRSVLIPIAVVAVGALIMITLIKTRSRPPRERQRTNGVLVEVLEVARGDRHAVVTGNGTVAPRYQVALVPQITGKVDWVHPELVAGTTFAAGDALLRIESEDYELAVQRAEAQIAQAEYQLDVARANAAVAQREWELMKRSRNGDQGSTAGRDGQPDPLVLHEPQLRQAEANLASARAALATARLNLERTTLRAPFDCRVRQQQVAPGQLVGPTNQVALLYATDLVEIEVGIPVGELAWLHIPGARATVTVEAGGEAYEWEGEVHRSVGVIDPVARLAQVVVRVSDPFAPASPGQAELSIGSFVHVQIEGRRVPDVIPIPRAALRPEQVVWVARADSTLETRSVQVIRLTPSEALVGQGLEDGERIIVSPLSGAVDGMRLRPVPMRRRDRQRAAAPAGGRSDPGIGSGAVGGGGRTDG